mmetsp:Transcript_43789/g.105629  ORF Transcript_43789/g.105629 Transcript_43789/m.105629 type:complete len:531 (-) Transcript_43789:838-2430(-)
MVFISTITAFLMTAFSLAELGDGFGMFFDMYLLGLGWSETSVIVSGILRGIVDFSLKGIVGDIIDKTTHDRRVFLGGAALAVALSSCMVFVVNGADDIDKAIVYIVRSLESIALSFLGPAFQAVTLAAFGPELFDKMQVQRELVSHAGSIVSAALSAVVAWYMYPNIQVLFLLPAVFAVSAIYFVRYIPRGDPLMGRGFHGTTEKRDEQGCVVDTHKDEPEPEAASYWDVFSDRRILWLTVADVFHVLAEANVGLVFNETLADVGTYSSANTGEVYDDDLAEYMEYQNGDDAVMSRNAIPLLATAGSAAQVVMIAGTFLVGYLTEKGWGRKPFYVAHLCVHPVRVALLLLCLYTNAGSAWLVSTEFVGGLTGAFGIVNAFMRADILFGSGRFNVVDGFQATIRGIAATSSSYIGAYILQNNGPMTALSISFCIAIIPPIIGAVFVPETLGMRQVDFNEEKKEEKIQLALSREEDGDEGLGGRLLSMLSGDYEDNASPRNTSEPAAHENYTELSNIPSSGSGSQGSNRELV